MVWQTFPDPQKAFGRLLFRGPPTVLLALNRRRSSITAVSRRPSPHRIIECGTAFKPAAKILKVIVIAKSIRA